MMPAMHAFVSALDRRSLWLSLGGLLALLAWEATGWDWSMAHWWGTAQGFALKDHWLLSGVLHNGARKLGVGVLLALLVFTLWPVGVLRRVPRADRWSLLLATVLTILSVSLLKGISTTSCPWDMQAFGGTLPYVSHFDWSQRDGGGGHCFPAGHASTGLAFMAAYFWLKDTDARFARRWLALAVLTGLGLGWVQQVRGAHYTSHTLWTLWLCWTVPCVLHSLQRGGQAWRRARVPTHE